MAKWRSVCPSPVLVAILPPLWRMNFTTSVCPISAARWSGKKSSISRLFKFPPFLSNSWVVSRWPLVAAIWRGVTPYLLGLFESAPCFSKTSTASEWPYSAAKKIGDNWSLTDHHCSLSFNTLTSAPYSIKRAMFPAWPPNAAWWIGK